MWMTMRRVLLGAVVLALPLEISGQTTARIEPHTFEAGDETVEAELGRFRVPLNRERGGADSLDLAFVRFPSTSPNPGPPIVYLAGGPGGSGISTARGSRFPLFMAFRKFGDVIAFDQRGTGLSDGPSPEACEITRRYPEGRPLYVDHLRHLTLEVARDCATMWREAGVDLSAYNTNESADDIAALAEALGVERIRLWAISYGTHLGLTTIRRHPGLVERAVLAGVEGPDHTVKMPHYWSDQLADLEDLIAADPEASAEFPDLTALIDTVLTRVEADPPVVEFVRPGGTDTVRSRVTAGAVKAATIDLLSDPGTMVSVPWLYRRMANGDFSAVASGAPEVGGFRAMSEAMDAASGMSEERLFRFLRDDEALLLGGGDDLSGAYMASALGIPDLGESFRSPVHSEIPALFISGTLDGRTPPDNAREVMQGFSEGRHLVIENAGHSDPLFLSSPEILEVMEAFWADGPLPTLRIQIDPPSLASGRLAPSLSPEFMEGIVGAYERGPGEVWRVVRQGMVRSLGPDGREVGRTVDFFIRIRGNGFPFVARADTTFVIPFFGPGLEFRFPRDASGAVVGMELDGLSEETEEFNKVAWDVVGFIDSRSWLMAGPYEAGTDAGAVCDAAFAPEERARAGRLDPQSGESAGAGDLRWTAAAGDDDFVNFEETLGGAVLGGVGYAHLVVHADEPVEAQIRTGTDDDARIFLNGERIHAHDGAREAWGEQDTIPVSFPAGDNRLLVKVCNRDADWRFNLRITDAAGRSIVTPEERGRVRLASPGG